MHFFQSPPFTYAGAILALILILICFMPLVLLFIYVVSFLFDKQETAQGAIPFILTWVSRNVGLVRSGNLSAEFPEFNGKIMETWK